MAAELEVIIGANTKGIEDGATRAERALKGVQEGITRLQREIKENITISKGYEGAIQDLTRAFKAGDISQKDYSNGIKRLQRDEKETGVETKRLTAELRNLQREQKQLSVGLNQGASSMNTLGKATSVNAVPAMTSFSQVVQDAPYGIQGVANNIQQLTMQMGYLSKSAGGTKAALGAMLSTLAGPTGILLAVSLITTLLVKYGDQLMELVGSTNKLTDATKEYIGEAMAEASELKVLVDIANNHNASIVARRKAIEEINSKYGEYLGNIDLESIKTDKVKDSINQLTRALIQQAQIKGLKDVISEETLGAAEKFTELQFKQIESYKQVQKELKAMDNTGYWGKVIQDSEDVIGSLERIAATGEKVPAGLATAVSGWREAGKEMKTLGDETAKTLEPFQKLQQALTEKVFGITVVPEFDQDEIVITGKKPTLKVDLEVTNPHSPDLLDLENDTAEMQKFVDNFYDADAKIREKLGEAGYEFRLNEAWEEEMALFSENIELFKEKLDGAKETADIFASSVGGAISELGGVLQEKFAEGGKAFEIFGGLVINTLTKVLAQMAQQLISEKIAAIATRKIEKGKAGAKGVTIATNAAAAMGPAGVVALPGLLVGVQAAIQAAFASTTGFNFGGFVGDRNLVRMNGDERVLTATQANRIDRIAMGQSVRMGGQSVDVNISGILTARGGSLVTVFNETQQVQSRRGK